MYFFILLVVYLVAEGWALVSVAGYTGWLAALALIFLVSMGGAYLVRRQGAMALFRIQEAIARNGSPDAELLDGVFIFMAGLLLFIPGFLSDLAGLALLIPPLRKTCGPWLLAYLKSRVNSGRYIKTYTVYDYEWRGTTPDDGRDGTGRGGQAQGHPRIIDVFSHEVSPTGPSDAVNPKGPDAAGKSSGDNTSDGSDGNTSGSHAGPRRPGNGGRSGA